MYELIDVEQQMTAGALPNSATANDVRTVIRYLRRRPRGVTLSEAIDAIKKQMFEPDKISAYETLGIVKRNGDRLVLTTFGWRLAEKMGPGIEAFRLIINRVEPYQMILAWANQQISDYLLHYDVAAFWQEHCPAALGINTPKMTEANVICLFQICQAAGLGTHILGKKGQPTRLRLDREELSQFVEAASSEEGVAVIEAPPDNIPTLDFVRADQSDSRTIPLQPSLRMFVSCPKESAITDSLVTALGLLDIETTVSTRTPSDTQLLDNRTAGLMRECSAGIFVVSGEDILTPGSTLKPHLQTELAVALVLYQGRIILLSEERLNFSANFSDFGILYSSGHTLTWDSAVQVLQAAKRFACFTRAETLLHKAHS